MVGAYAMAGLSLFPWCLPHHHGERTLDEREQPAVTTQIWPALQPSELPSQGDSLTQDTIPDPELQASRRCHLSKDTKRVLNAKGESRHVQVAITSIDIDKQIKIAARGCFPARH
jgi:hypothetical protein